MKCLILAGGSGGGLWPLSRNKYPKQFIEIREGRSLFQETVVRNIPFCDEFIIVANEKYRYVVENQMKVFKCLNYRLLFEQEGRNTAFATIMGALFCNSSDLMFVVSCNSIIDIENYKEYVLRAKQIALQGSFVLFGMEIAGPETGYGYIKHEDEKVLNFIEKPNKDDAIKFYEDGNYLWNSGMVLVQVGAFLNEIQEKCGELYFKCREVYNKIHNEVYRLIIPDTAVKSVPSISIERAFYEKNCDKLRVIYANFDWIDINDLNSLSKVMNSKDLNNIITNRCEDLTVINNSYNRLVVVNEMKNVVVVNTDDAVYVTKKDSVDNIKKLVCTHNKKYSRYFDENSISYRPWGTYQVLNECSGYKVKKVVVYPGCFMSLHKHENRSEHWSIVEGVATITLGDSVKEYKANDSAYVKKGMLHRISNHTDRNTVIIEVEVGDIILENDTITVDRNNDSELIPEIVRLKPAYKDYLWGGKRLREELGKQCEYDIIAESWELSAHKDGVSIIDNGQYNGMRFDQYISQIGREYLGWKTLSFDKFPILIKFIDAKNSLSVQVHPDDDFALRAEGEYGKNEMWYVMDCEEGSYIYCGLKRNVTKEELKNKILSNTLDEVLNKVYVKKGDSVFIPAGTIHAIGSGILICEVQQNSNSTYRIYDYDRRDKYGNRRELHLEKALEVVDTNAYVGTINDNLKRIEFDGYYKRCLCSCKYFEVWLYEVHCFSEIISDKSSFCAIVMLEGSGILEYKDEQIILSKGETFYIPANMGLINIKGRCKYIVTHM